jgi:hypothetical protein
MLGLIKEIKMPRSSKSTQKQSFLIASLTMILWVLASVSVKAEEAPLSPNEVKAIISMIENTEKGVHNIKIDAESWVEEKAPASNSWQRTPTEFSCTAWMDGHLKGKVRVDVNKEILKWKDGAAPYTGRSYTVSFDGTNTKFIEKTTGPSDKQFPKKEGQVLPGISEGLMSRIIGSCVGWRFTTNFFFNNNEEHNLSFSQIFRAQLSPEAAKSDVHFDFIYEQKDGVLCLKFGSKPAKWGRETWWFDPNRGFALIAYLHTNTDKDGIEHVVSNIKVNKLQEVAPGIWWPMEATVESEPRDPNETYKRTVYRAVNVIANDPNFDESVFSPPFPKGYRVNNKITGKNYIVDANLDMIEELKNPRK